VVNDAKAAAMFTNRCYFFSSWVFKFLLLPARVKSLCNPAYIPSYFVDVIMGLKCVPRQ
jgi:hypothetical protein